MLQEPAEGVAQGTSQKPVAMKHRRRVGIVSGAMLHSGITDNVRVIREATAMCSGPPAPPCQAWRQLSAQLCEDPGNSALKARANRATASTRAASPRVRHVATTTASAASATQSAPPPEPRARSEKKETDMRGAGPWGRSSESPGSATRSRRSGQGGTGVADHPIRKLSQAAKVTNRTVAPAGFGRQGLHSDATVKVRPVASLPA